MTNMANITTFVALYQAGESLYDHFDKVLLIYGGRCAYFGPVEDAKEYFQRLGFACPPRWTTADFLTSTTDVHARHVRKGWENRVPRTPEEFESAYRKSAIAKGVLREMREFEEELGKVKAEREREMTEETRRKNYQVGYGGDVVLGGCLMTAADYDVGVDTFSKTSVPMRGTPVPGTERRPGDVIRQMGWHLVPVLNRRKSVLPITRERYWCIPSGRNCE